MLRECWVKWHPLPDVSNIRYSVDLVKKKGAVLVLLLVAIDNAKKQWQLSFEDSVVFYKSTNESALLNAEYPICDADGKALNQWNFYIITNSPIITWLSKESCLNQPLKLQHFVFVSLDSVIDVVAICEPRVEEFCGNFQ